MFCGVQVSKNQKPQLIKHIIFFQTQEEALEYHQAFSGEDHKGRNETDTEEKMKDFGCWGVFYSILD